MDRKETDQEAKATKNTKKVWLWVLVAGVLLMAIAFWGGFFNHGEQFGNSDTPSQHERMPMDTTASDTTMVLNPDTIMKSVRGTE
ncbi:hypothetical protein [Dyadobacter sp. 3J3]|uniref:hypothetical protein n=1 Tax=Dyadobacter sp. 3J3 TaxID=2606600 RepID=UPI0013576CD1|nr:hypothetical protein [Dyadobacter sp. 3J3]